jgi:hypothetical protein
LKAEQGGMIGLHIDDGSLAGCLIAMCAHLTQISEVINDKNRKIDEINKLTEAKVHGFSG